MDFPGPLPSRAVVSTVSPESVGGLIDQNFAYGSAAWPSANQAFFMPLVVRSPFLIRKFAWANGTGVAGNVDAGVYSPGGARLVSTGATAQAGTSVVQSVTLGTPYLLTPGLYLLALSASSTSAQFARANPSAVQLQATGCAQMASAHPLPDPATLASSSSQYLPLFGIVSVGVI